MKKGISLIVLIITIIVIIILAGAVILNLSDNNPIDSAQSAAVLSEQSDLNSAITLWLGSEAAENAYGYKIIVKDKATTFKNATDKLIDANGNEVTGDFYELNNITITCGYGKSETGVTLPRQIFGAAVESNYVLADGTKAYTSYDTAIANLLSSVKLNDTKYAGDTGNYRVVMNSSGNVKIVEKTIK